MDQTYTRIFRNGCNSRIPALEGIAAVTGDEKSALQEESNNKSLFNWYHAY
ncbi:hypothetical protein ACQKKK_08380 [Peribacillus sp. NPDC006672]|uniref:hypothetical protein n=1 Tax=Peribacillus sp. NPDC006672 TaxID=3390606 RepID=UPI003D07F272